MRAQRGRSLGEFLLFGAAALLFVATRVPQLDRAQGFVPRQRAAEVLRVVTWNLGTGVDAGTASFQEESIVGVAQTLEALDPDLVFLQELDSRSQLKRLVAALGDGWQYTYARAIGTRSLGVLSQRGRLRRELSSSLERAIAVTFESETGARLLCVGIHANAFSSRERNRSIGIAGRFLQDRGRGFLSLLAGDLNLDLDIDKRRDLFTDNEHLDVETYNFRAQRLLDTGIGRGPTAKPDRRIDYIFVELERFDVLAGGPWAGHRLGGMDHEPVVVDLRPLAQKP